MDKNTTAGLLELISQLSTEIKNTGEITRELSSKLNEAGIWDQVSPLFSQYLGHHSKAFLLLSEITRLLIDGNEDKEKPN